MVETLFVGMLGPTEMMIVLMLAVLLFGAQKLPKLARATGQASGEFRRGRNEIERELKEMTTLESTPEEGVDDGDPAVVESPESSRA